MNYGTANWENGISKMRCDAVVDVDVNTEIAMKMRKME